MAKTIEEVITATLSGDAQRNALALVAHIRTCGRFPITQHDTNDESGWNVAGLGFLLIMNSNDFPGPWTMWIPADKLGENAECPIDEGIKNFAWKHVSSCGSCGGDCAPGALATVFGRVFENTCQTNLMFHNPDADAVEGMKGIIDLK